MAVPMPPSTLNSSTATDTVRVGKHRVSTELLDTLRQASRSAGVDFGFLVSQAAQESGFRTDAQAKTSSARGLFQFVEGTWLEMVRDHGAKYGLSEQAAQITRGSDGRPKVNDPAQRQAILALRDDPRLSSAMAAEYARANRDILAREFGVEASKTDLYLGHFLGPNGASKFLGALRENSQALAADLLPDAASSNPTVFFDSAGNKRSLADIHAYFTRKLDAHAEGLDTAAETTATAAPQDGPGSVARYLEDQRRQVDHMAKMMAFEALNSLMRRANRISDTGSNSDSSW